MPDDTPQPGWVYKPGDNSAVQPSQDDNQAKNEPSPDNQTLPNSDTEAAKTSSEEAITWTASEYVAHHKTFGWYALFLLGILVCSGLIYFITKDLISSGVIGFAGILFAALASKKPRQLSYKADIAGITIDGKFYPYTQFKFFSLAQEGMIGCVNFWPLKRFMPELSIYYPPEQGDQIVKIISEHLPHEEHQEHAVDKLLKKLRF